MIFVNLFPDFALYDVLLWQRKKRDRHKLTTELAQHLLAQLVKFLNAPLALSGKLGDQSDAQLDEICTALPA